MINKQGKSKLLVNYGGYGSKGNPMPESWYSEGVEISFEGLRVNAPKEYNMWLTQAYGDYMKLPPKEEQVGHHWADVVDLHRPYTEYV